MPRTRIVPTADEKAGRFNVAVFDPFTAGRPEFARNAEGQWVIPESQWDPVGANISSSCPTQTFRALTGMYRHPSLDTRSDQFDVKIDDRPISTR